jgi:hypothetical protein
VAAPEPHIVIHPTRVISWGLDEREGSTHDSGESTVQP